MVEIRPVESDADYEAWRQVRIAALPYERCPSVAELRAQEAPGRLLVIAEADGQVVGHGLADRSSESGRAAVAPRVRPEARRQGVGTALLRALTEHARAQGHTVAGTTVDDDGSFAFAERFGFTESGRQVEQVRAIGAEPSPPAPTAYEIVSVAERPELWARAYDQVAVPTFPDMATRSPLQVTAEEWATEWINDPAAMFVALDGADVIGVAGLMIDTDQPQRAEVAYTAVRRSWRGKGVAATLKRTSMAWAAQNGITEIYTWTQEGNADMRRLNEHLGFRYGIVSIDVRAELPLQFAE
ncbi:GNAT family N-acetyltransferase [Kribbella sandramycini]|uniref:GNAT family N-acetyltransferase n=1 Tax=Kribbella sandramycini TaxID=60450 RepID=A0A7Y4KWB5_9ACTN|nr:GNAT family N-acetyltransferase [Kribbella sandramycini]MBB6567517.1 GNAT superfamily N-acetyltransferase [Kribbella sandramycini]NOL39877.1 GNAT family N-acetyltransferase [Kribbella sandramycini]